MKIHLVIQARMNSSRLPNKVLKKIEDKTVLQHVIDRCYASKHIDKITVATTTNPLDDVLEKYCIENKLNYFRGSEENVLERFYNSTINDKPDILIRITSDCPLIDVNIVDDMIDYFIENRLSFLQPKYSRGNNQTKMGGFPDGCNPQIFTYETLCKAYNCATTAFDKEHVCPYMVRNCVTNEYVIPNTEQYTNIDFSKLHLSLDTEDDYNHISDIFNHLYKRDQNFTIYDVLTMINSDPTNWTHPSAR
tara:strand:+ start:1244 stop:1990 length:747 start_codon:yes stop_codon:yes gene_type:complete